MPQSRSPLWKRTFIWQKYLFVLCFASLILVFAHKTFAEQAPEPEEEESEQGETEETEVGERDTESEQQVEVVEVVEVVPEESEEQSIEIVQNVEVVPEEITEDHETDEDLPPPDQGETTEPDQDECRTNTSTYMLEAIEIRGNRWTRDRVILRDLAFQAGQALDLEDERIEESRYRLLASGFFTDVQMSIRRGTEPGAVILVIEVDERWTFLMARELYLGVSEITPYGGVSLQSNNLFGLGISVSGSFVASREQQAHHWSILYPRFLDGPVALSLSFLYNDARDFLGRYPVLVTGFGDDYQHYAEFQYRRLGGSFGVGVALSSNTNIYFDWRLEYIRAHLPYAAAQINQIFGEEVGEPIDFHLFRGRSIVSAINFSVEHDTLDHPVLPSQGRRISASTMLSSDIIGSHYHFVKITTKLDFYFRLPWEHSFRVGMLIGLIFGTAPLYELYFIGDLSDQVNSRVLDLNFGHVFGPNVFDNSIAEMRYESLAGRIDFEYIVPLYRGHRGVYGLDFFFEFGFYALGSQEDFSSPPAGYDGGAFPIDFTIDIGLRLDTTAGVFGFSFGGLLGLIPLGED